MEEEYQKYFYVKTDQLAKLLLHLGWGEEVTNKEIRQRLNKRISISQGGHDHRLDEFRMFMLAPTAPRELKVRVAQRYIVTDV